MAKNYKLKTENEATDETVAPANNSALALFSAAESVGKLKRISRPPILKPADWPVGSVIRGEVVKFVPPFDKKINRPLLQIRTEAGAEVLLPITRGMSELLTEEGEGRDELVGKEIAIQYQGTKPSKNYKGKIQHVFDIYLSE